MNGNVEIYPAELQPIFTNIPRMTDVERQFITRAYQRAAKAHEGQLRKSGEPFILHPIAVAQILSELKLDPPALAAAFLHDVVEDTPITLEDISAEFGETVADLVDGVTKMEHLPTSPEAAVKGHKPGNKEAETLRKLFLSMSDDMRVVLIKLADRLHNMRTLGSLPPDRQRRMARETMDIFAPLANRLGIWQMKWELEDLCFRYLHADKYKEIVSHLAERRQDRQEYMEHIKAKVLKALNEAGIEAQVSARPKHIYSIYKKMDRKKVDFSSIFDVRAVRVIVADKTTCYMALGVVHGLWRPIPTEFDDYIASPKENFYQSLHTAVVDDEGKTVEIQIRTMEMHEHAEYGVAAHWRYKEGVKADPEFEKRLNYLRHLMEFDHDKNAEEFVNAMKSDVFENRVYVFTPKGDIVDMPAGATPIDFAYHIHTEIGHRCRGARVNGQLVGLDYHLRSSDRIEILTAKRGGPSLDWLNPDLGYVRTNRAADKIRVYFRKLDRDKNILAGTEVVDRELKRLGVGSMPRETIANLFSHPKIEDFLWNVGVGEINGAQIAAKVLEAERERHISNGKEIVTRELHKVSSALASDTVARLFGYPRIEDFLAMVGSGSIAPAQIVAKIADVEHKAQTTKRSTGKHTAIKLVGGASEGTAGIDMMGDKGTMLINLGRCCNPAQGDAIVGFITRGRGVTVHRADCTNIINCDQPERLIPVNWGLGTERSFSVPVIILAYDREGLMRDIGAITANENINVVNVNISTKNGVATFLVTMQIEDVGHLSKVLNKIEQLPNVLEARRRV